ncbi:3-dehydroquinate synthase [hydrothermal vent metagenome]|uniref:3-dehydroquinate synthase n=1 Tax=hydrothermal vent metagenome TaxID=652676 RepID=A0A3B0YY85_9ZZZZ
MFTFTNPRHQMSCELKREYHVNFTDGILESTSSLLTQTVRHNRVLVITTPTVYKHYGERFVRLAQEQGLDLVFEVLSLTEQTKTFESVEKICEWSQHYNLGRSDILIAFGGGVCSDAVSVAASLIRRGIRHIRIPTTLIGQIDAAIGLKGGINFRNHKNYLGCFYPPSDVFIDPGFLGTLNRESLSHGFAEIVKMALVCDAELFDKLQCHGSSLLNSSFTQPADAASHVIERAVQLMLKELRENPYENITSERLVDMGHTFSPYLEAASKFSIQHGEAVAIDMALTSLISVELGLLQERDAHTIINLLSNLGLPIWSPLMTSELCSFSIKEAALHRRGNLNLIVLEGIGRPRFIKSAGEVEGGVLDRALAKLAVHGERMMQGPEISRNCVDWMKDTG